MLYKVFWVGNSVLCYKQCFGFGDDVSSEVVDEFQKTTETESKEQTIFTDFVNINSDPN
ncbi:hypothetical protein Hanom_Chr09g00776981 [Helianthus anomalus]